MRSLRNLAASTRLPRTAFGRVRFLSRLIVARLRLAILALVAADRALRTLAASTRLLRTLLARATEWLPPRDPALREIVACPTWLPPLADATCAVRAPPLADPCVDLPLGALSAVSTSARLPIHVKNTMRFMVLPLFFFR